MKISNSTNTIDNATFLAELKARRYGRPAPLEDYAVYHLGEYIGCMMQTSESADEACYLVALANGFTPAEVDGTGDFEVRIKYDYTVSQGDFHANPVL